MNSTRRIAMCAVPTLLLVSVAAVAQTVDRSWQGPAAAAADAAAAKSSAQAIVPPIAPAPVAAAKPAPSEIKSAEQKVTAADAKADSDDAAPGEGDTVDGKQTDGKSTAAAAPVAAEPAEPAKGADPKAKGKDAKGKEAKEKKPPPIPARQLFGAVKTAAPLQARAIGWYAKGCLAGAKALPIDGPAWQVMRLSRNRNWGHPDLIALLERFAGEVKKNNEWPGLLVGDISQPRGGPMLTGHASHQVGLDADIWFTPMPDRTLTKREREDLSATSMLAAGDLTVDPTVWGDRQVKLIKRAASYSKVERVLVHPAIKKALCEATASDPDKTWLKKVRPYWGHYYHFHVRIGCPGGAAICKSQPPVPGDDGCGAEVTDWLKKIAKSKQPSPPTTPTAKPGKPAPPKPVITLADLPPDCRSVLSSGGNKPPTSPMLVQDLSKDAAPPPKAAVATSPTPAAQKASATTQAATPIKSTKK